MFFFVISLINLYNKLKTITIMQNRYRKYKIQRSIRLICHGLCKLWIGYVLGYDRGMITEMKCALCTKKWFSIAFQEPTGFYFENRSPTPSTIFYSHKTCYNFNALYCYNIAILVRSDVCTTCSSVHRRLWA